MRKNKEDSYFGRFKPKFTRKLLRMLRDVAHQGIEVKIVRAFDEGRGPFKWFQFSRGLDYYLIDYDRGCEEPKKMLKQIIQNFGLNPFDFKQYLSADEIIDVYVEQSDLGEIEKKELKYLLMGSYSDATEDLERKLKSLIEEFKNKYKK